MKIFITGMSGTGKTSVANELSKKGVMTFDIDSILGLCSWVSYETGEKVSASNTGDINDVFLAKHDYKCDTEILEKMMNNKEETSVVFGAVGDNSDLLPLFDKVFLLQTSPEIMIKRLQTRETNDFGKDESVHNTLIEWKKVFDKLMIEQGAVLIDAEQTLDEVVMEICTHF